MELIDHGVFSSRTFSDRSFRTEKYADETMGPPDKYTLFQRVLQEDEEILEFIVNAVVNGMVE